MRAFSLWFFGVGIGMVKVQRGGPLKRQVALLSDSVALLSFNGTLLSVNRLLFSDREAILSLSGFTLS